MNEGRKASSLEDRTNTPFLSKKKKMASLKQAFVHSTLEYVE
jgi:hypothetical protein